MTTKQTIQQLAQNKAIFQAYFENTTKEEYQWRPAPEKWNLLDILCHLYDEEREDFRTRVGHVLKTPDVAPPPIDPEGWVTSRDYQSADFEEKLKAFLKEREESIVWLNGLDNPNWENTYQHPEYGLMSARMFLDCWLAHDYLHLRQIQNLKYAYLKAHSNENLKYAGNW